MKHFYNTSEKNIIISKQDKNKQFYMRAQYSALMHSTKFLSLTIWQALQFMSQTRCSLSAVRLNRLMFADGTQHIFRLIFGGQKFGGVFGARRRLSWIQLLLMVTTTQQHCQRAITDLRYDKQTRNDMSWTIQFIVCNAFNHLHCLIRV